MKSKVAKRKIKYWNLFLFICIQAWWLHIFHIGIPITTGIVALGIGGSMAILWYSIWK